MKLESLHISRVPGIDQPFTVDDLANGMNVIVGPNGIGKSSLCRAVRALLWADIESSRQTSASATFSKDGEQWRVARDGDRHQWEKNGAAVQPPLLPPSHLQNCFFLQLPDLLKLSDIAGYELAAQIRLQMAGGFDLDGVLKDFSLSSTIGRKERKQLDDAESKIRDGVREQSQLVGQEASLSELQVNLNAARDAQHNLKSIEKALDLANFNAGLSDKNAEIENMPAVLDRLSGHELDQLRQQEEELENKRRELHRAESAREAAENMVKTTELSEPIDDAVLAVWRGRAEALSSLEQDVKALEAEQSKLEAGAVQAAKMLHGREDIVPSVDVCSVAKLYKFLREAQDLDATEQAILERLNLINDSEYSSDDDSRLQLLRSALESLRSWMRSPDPGSANQQQAQLKHRTASLVLGTLLLLSGGLGTFFWSPFFLVLSGLGLGIGGAAVWFTRTNRTPAGERNAAEIHFPAGLEGPGDWSVSGVMQRLRTIEGEIAELETASRLKERYAQERDQLEKRLEPITIGKDELKKRREELASQLNLDDVLPDADLVDTLRAVDQVRQARVAEHGGMSQLENTRGKVVAGLDDLVSELSAFGYVPASDATEAKAQIEKLARRDNTLRQAQDEVATADKAIKAGESSVEDYKERIDNIYQATGLPGGDKVGLVQLMDQIDTYCNLRDERNSLINNVQRAEAQLSEMDSADLIKLSADQLNHKREELVEHAETIESLVGEITEIETKVELARSAHGQEDALAERAEALSALQDAQNGAIRAAAGRFLLDSIKQEHEITQMPRVLERARELFALFTYQRYGLRLAPDESKSFIAVETRTGEGHRPDQLSDGTRAQLLVAVRLAFAEDAEQGDTVPLFLDEALDHADPERFRAMVQSLGQIADERGRQVIYLTNDPADVRRIEIALAEGGASSARVIDLGAIRNQAASVADQEELVVESVPTVPLPETNEDSAAYAMRLGVPTFDPTQGADWQHLYYLTWDDSALLHRCLSAGIEHVGQWRMLCKQDSSTSEAIIAEHLMAAQLDARAMVLKEYCLAWQEGRGGGQVPREAIEASEAVSNTFLGRVVELLEELNGDGGELVRILKTRSDSRVQGFRTASAEAIEKTLIEGGFIDEREVLGESDVLTRVLSTPAAEQLPADVVRECVHRWWQYADKHIPATA